MVIHETLTMKLSIKLEKASIDHLSKKSPELFIHRKKRNREETNSINPPQVAMMIQMREHLLYLYEETKCFTSMS
jgi:hypothetical protein